MADNIPKRKKHALRNERIVQLTMTCVATDGDNIPKKKRCLLQWWRNFKYNDNARWYRWVTTIPKKEEIGLSEWTAFPSTMTMPLLADGTKHFPKERKRSVLRDERISSTWTMRVATVVTTSLRKEGDSSFQLDERFPSTMNNCLATMRGSTSLRKEEILLQVMNRFQYNDNCRCLPMVIDKHP